MSRADLRGYVVLIVVIAVGAIAGAYYWFSSGSPAVSDSVQSPQDRRRLIDMHNLQAALTAYHKDTGKYPSNPVGEDCQPAFNNLGGLKEILVPNYIQDIPIDPAPASCEYNYFYYTDLQNYSILVHLDDLNPGVYKDRWCIGAASTTIPSLYREYRRCP